MIRNLYPLFLLLIFSCSLNAQPPFEISRNIYRVPDANNTSVEVSRDHYSHSPEQGRYDMHAEGILSSCGSNYRIVAAAAGVIRRIVDHHMMHGPDCPTDDCTQYNNYVWIEHANGEWSKYSHMRQFSTTADAGLQVGDCVSAGQFLGYECEIGNATGPHLHFEVRRPNDPANVQISVSGGFMSDADHLIPAVCGIARGFFNDGDEITVASCTPCNAGEIISISNVTYLTNSVHVTLTGGLITTGSNVNILSNTATLLKAALNVTLNPGVTVQSGAYLHVVAGPCGTTSFNGSCN